MVTPKIVLTADRTLMSPYRGISLATFFGCAPAIDPNRDKNSFWYKILKNQVTPKVLFDFICNWSPDINGVAKYAPYGLRKVEAGLLRDGYARKDVVVAHPNHTEKFIGPETEVVGTYEIKHHMMNFTMQNYIEELMQQRKKMVVMPKLLLVHLVHGNTTTLQKKLKNMDSMQF